MSNHTAAVSFFVALLLGVAMAWAGSRGGAVTDVEPPAHTAIAGLLESLLSGFAAPAGTAEGRGIPVFASSGPKRHPVSGPTPNTRVCPTTGIATRCWTERCW